MKKYSFLQHGIASAALLALIALGGVVCAVFQGQSAEVNSPHAVVEGIYAQRDAAWEMKLDAPAQLVIGKTDARITLHSSRPGHFYLIQAGTDGKSLELVFPNALDGNNNVAAGETVLPRANWRFTASGPAGTGELLAVITPAPVSESALRSALAEGQKPDMGTQFGAARAIWTEIKP